MISSRMRIYLCVSGLLALIVTFARLTVMSPSSRDQQPVSARVTTSHDYPGAFAKLKQYQKLFSDSPESEVSVDPSNASTVTSWWQAAALIEWYIEDKPRYKCKNLKNFGNWAACMDHPFTVTPPCIVYSFGIAFDFSFDDAMAKHGCQVYSFDPSMGKPDYQRSKNSWFYNLGLSSYNTDKHRAPVDGRYVKKPQIWKLRTLTSIKKMLGHTGKAIDVLKIDIEGFEWKVLDNLMETGELKLLRQFLLEFHLFPRFPPMHDYVKLYKSYTKLRKEHRFLEFSVSPHKQTLVKERFNVQGDSQFVNSLFLYPSSP
ncbi:hypothetical protein RRG08_004866 [Elysia crispata]|uniref:Methyltransferase domain-containing protein n=1 Tax=Elysia crispata TaxID=231223 RepID=A0AAE1B5W1_9GAST|nr:hypothetical protein RRG08_004866 [Elysia crispata]